MIDLAIIHRICQENLVKAVKGETEAEKVWWQHYNVQYHVLDGPRYLPKMFVCGNGCSRYTFPIEFLWRPVSVSLMGHGIRNICHLPSNVKFATFHEHLDNSPMTMTIYIILHSSNISKALFGYHDSAIFVDSLYLATCNFRK